MKTCSIDDLKANFRFDAETGIITRMLTEKSFKAGDRSGSRTSHGYLMLKFHEVRCLAHRAAFAMYYGCWPIGQIDHINGDRTDNRISNLREVSNSQNQMNAGLNSRNTSGCKGIWWSKDESRWRAHIIVDKKKLYLGSYKTPDEAAHAYNKAAIRLHGEFARLNPIGTAAPTPETKG